MLWVLCVRLWWRGSVEGMVEDAFFACDLGVDINNCMATMRWN